MIEFLFLLAASFLIKKYFITDDEQQKETTAVKKILIEKIDQQYYAWDIDKKEEFITQSKSIDDIITLVSSKFKDFDIMLNVDKETECQLKNLKIID